MKKLLIFACAALLFVSANAQKTEMELPCKMSGLSAFLYMDLMELQKNDPSLKSIPDEMRDRYVFHTINSELYVGAFADIKAEKRKLAAEYGVLFNGKEELPFMTVNIPLKNYISFLNSGIADYIEVGEKNYPMMDSARRVTHAALVNSGYNLPQGYTGKGVIVGIIDIGFDYTHRNFYDSTETTYRVKRVWDQNASSGTPPSGYSYGNELTTQADILAAQKSHTNETHGTHVAGMAAGGGTSETAMRKYKGMAPESDIVLVATTMSSNDVLDGLEYILSYAQSEGKPCVVNMSLGNHVGPHDGQDYNEIYTDYLFQNTYTKGAALMVSAGNEGEDRLHIGKTFTAQDSTLYTFVVKGDGRSAYSGTVDIWGTQGSNFRVKIAMVDSTSTLSQLRNVSFPLTINTNSSQTSTVTAVISTNCTVRYATYTSNYYYNNKPRVYLNLSGSSTNNGRYCFLIKVESTSGTIHMWNNSGKFNGGTAGTPGNTNYTSNNKGSGNTSTMVASYNTKVRWQAYNGNGYQLPGYTIGARSGFSSIGPGLNTNLNKPEITAPGCEILSSYNKYDASYSTSSPYITHVQSTGGCWWGIMQGTSMACPATTGIVALWMELCPTLSWSQVKEVMRASAVSDSYTGTIPSTGSPQWGWGKIDAYRGIQYLKSKMPQKPVTSPASSTYFCAGGSTTLTAPAGYSRYEWSTGDTTRSITVSTAGTYRVRVDSVGYFSEWSDGVTVSRRSVISTTITGNRPICPGERLTLTVNASSSILSTTYQWNNGSPNDYINVTPRQTTRYWVTTSRLGFCPKTDTITVVVRPEVSTTVTPNQTICQGSSVTLSVSGGTSRNWSTGETTNSITVTPSSSISYSVTSHESGYCDKTDRVVVTVQPYVSTTISRDTTICQGQSVTLTSTGGTSRAWSTGDTSSSITVTPQSTTRYIVTSNENNKCSKTDTVTVTVRPNLTTTVTPNQTICRGSSVTLSVSGGTSHNWNTGATGSSITVSPSSTTTYTVTSNQNGYCSKTDNITITVQPYVSTTISSDTTICQGQSVTLSSTGGTSRRWSNNSTSQNITVTPSSTTRYTVTCSQNGYCSTTDTVTVTVRPNISTTISRDTTICQGQSVTLTSTGGTSRRWSNNSTSQSITVAPSSSTTYTVTVEQNGYCPKTDVVRVTVQPYVSTTISSDQTICQGSSATLTVSGGTSRVWSYNNSTATSITVTPSQTTTYTVTSSQSGKCSTTDTVTVTVQPYVSTTISRDTTICQGQTVTLTSTGGTSRRWSNNSTSQSITVTPSSTTRYTVTSSQNGYCSTTDTVTVTVLPYVNTTITSNQTICQGSSVTLSVSGGTSRVWSYNNSTATSITVTPSQTTTYTVTSSQSGKCSTTDTVTITVQPYVSTTISRDTTICQGQTVTLTSTGGTSRRWSNNSTSQSITVTPSSTTRYTVTSSQNNYCSTTDTVTVTVQPYVSTTISRDTTICAGATVNLTVSGGTSRIWSNNATGTTITVTPSTTTRYTVVSSAANQCSTTDSVTVTVKPYVATTITPDTAICIGQSITLTVSGGTSRTWSNDSTSTSFTITPSATTTYTVTSNQANHCSTTDTVTVTVQPYVATTISGDTSICPGEPVNLTVTGGTSWTWSNGGTTSTITVRPITPTTYIVTSSQNNYCSTTDTVRISIKPSVTTTVSGNTTICRGASATLTATGGISRTWSTGETQDTIIVTPTVTTTYAVRSDSTGICSNIDSIKVTVNQLPNVSITGDTVITAGNSATLVASGANSYVWSTGATSPSITVSPAATTSYSVEGTDVNGCRNTTRTTVVVNAVSIASGSELEFKVYPIPTESKLTVEGESIKTITIYNILGKVIDKIECDGERTVVLTVKDYAQGVYVISVADTKGQTGRRTFIVR